MRHRQIAFLLTAALLGVVAVANSWTRPTTPPSYSDTDSVWVHLVFGLDSQEANWSGQLRTRNASVGQVLPWGFEREDRLDAERARWECVTVVRRGRSAASFAEPFRGLFVEVKDARTDAALELDTAQGRFTVELAELRYDRIHPLADNRASAQLVPSPTLISSPAGENDFPTLTMDRDGTPWMAWIQFDPEELTDRLLVLRLDGTANSPFTIPAGRYIACPQLVSAFDRLGLFWTEWDGTYWRLKESWWDGKAWSPPSPVYDHAGHALFLQATAGPDGSVWLVWQGLGPNDRNPRIECLRLDRAGKRLHSTVATGEGGRWEPAIDVSADGRAWIAFDSYQNGNYDVYLIDVTVHAEGLRAAKALPIAATEDFEAHADVDARDERFVWVAYDAAGPNWGKDFAHDTTRRAGTYAEPLHASRRIELRVYDRRQNRVLEPSVPLPQVRNPRQPARVSHSYQEETIRFYELPQFARDQQGRLWVLYRLNRQGYCGHPPMGAVWELCATTYVDGRWIDPVVFPHSRGRQEQKAAIFGDRIAWSSGHHHVDLPYRVFTASLPQVDGTQRVPLVPIRRPRPSPAVSRRSKRKTYKVEDRELLYGDLHRHTEISLCTPTVDGSLTETYRYALDVAPLDFLAVTDHTRDTDPYPWWLTQKAADMFYVPGHFVTIYAYERSNAIVNGGHRNVFFRERNWPVLRSDAYYSAMRQPAPDTRPDTSLYPRLRGRHAFTIAHTPGFNARADRGTWTYHDPQVEPVAEIFQAYRRDYERPDPPDVPEQASLWYALGRGHRLGFIASSDHHSTHLSFACVWARERTRDGVFEGIAARHTFGAMDEIFLEVRVNDVLMGGSTALAPDAPPRISIRAEGTAPIDELQVIRSARVVRTVSPNSRTVDFSLVDDTCTGDCYYYVRLRQTDGTVAWSSPVWVTASPPPTAP